MGLRGQTAKYTNGVSQMKSVAIRAGAVLAIVMAFVASGVATGHANHSWGSYHWATTTKPFTLQLGNNMTSGWQTYLTTASSDWSSTAFDGQTDSFGNVVSNPLRTAIVAGAHLNRCGAVRGRIEVCDGSYGQNGWLGLAQIWLSNGHIVQGATKMNDTYFNMSRYNNPNEKLHVVCQEIGHTFGLDHQSTSGASLNTCMDYFSNTGTNAISTLSTHPNVHDYGQLTRIYNHDDGYTSYSAAIAVAARRLGVPGGGGARGVDEDGTPRGASPDRGEWYVEDLGNGQQLVTHIVWAERGH
jgi:hypothetical protein